MKPTTPPGAERAHDILRARTHPLEVFFAPQTVAVIGATEAAGSVGRTILWNLVSNPFGGTVFPVNPKRTSVLGIKAYPTVSAVPEKVDLAVAATPARTVPAIIGECAAAGVQGAIVISAGFKECGQEGAELFERLIEIARQEKLDHIVAEILPENRDMLRFSEKLGFHLYRTIDDPTVKAILDLNSLPSPSLT